MSPALRLAISILVLIAVFFVGTAGYMVIEVDRNIDFFDAGYMTAITLSTVGFHEQWDMSRTAQWWTLGVITFGIAAVSIAFTSLITLFVGGEIRSLREQRKMNNTIDNMKDHIIVCGYGRMGAMVATELIKQGLPIVVVERSHDADTGLSEAAIPHINEDATEEEALLKAGVQRARALVVTLPHDADNVFITLSARSLNSTLSILSRAEQPSTEAKLRRAGATRVVCPPQVGAMTISNMVMHPNVIDSVEITEYGLKLEMDEFVIASTSSLTGKSLREANLREETGAVVVAIKRADGKTIYSPKSDAVIGGGDTLIVVGPAGVSGKLWQLTSPAG